MMNKNPHVGTRTRRMLTSASGLAVAAVIGATLIIVTLPSYGQVTSNVLLRTLLIRASEGGTGFTIEVDGRQYLITAKHVVGKLLNESVSTIQVRKKNDWSPLKVTVFKCDDPVDIAVLVPPAQITVNYPLEPTSKGMFAGQEAYFVGFPYGTFATYTNQTNIFGFIKRATVARFDSAMGTGAHTIELDGYNNPGFSGSPVVFRDLNENGIVFKVAGVLVSYVYDASPVVNKKQEIHEDEITAEDREKNDVVRTITDGRLYRVEDTKQLVKLNSGIATAWDICSAVDLIRKHPIGPKAADNFTGEDASTQSQGQQ